MMRCLRKPSQSHAQDQRGTLAIGAIGLVLVVILFGSIPLLQRMETRFAPVTKPAIVFNARPTEGGAIVSARSFKFRDCDWVKTEFRWGSRDGRSVPMDAARHLGKPQLNKGGDSLYWEEIFLPIEPESVHLTHWNAYHLCYPTKLWRTKTEFFQ